MDLARLAAALDPVMRRCRTPGERVAVMRAARASPCALSPGGAGAGRHLEHRGGEVDGHPGGVLLGAVEQGQGQVTPHPGDDGRASEGRQQRRGEGLAPGGEDQHRGGVGLRRD